MCLAVFKVLLRDICHAASCQAVVCCIQHFCSRASETGLAFGGKALHKRCAVVGRAPKLVAMGLSLRLSECEVAQQVMTDHKLKLHGV